MGLKTATTTSSNQGLDRAVAYLRDISYNPDLGLCREAPRVAPNVYWVASDSLQAYPTLGPSNTATFR